MYGYQIKHKHTKKGARDMSKGAIVAIVVVAVVVLIGIVVFVRSRKK